MATSGSKSVAVTSYDTLKFSWERTSYSIEDNTSTIKWKLELIATANGAISSSASKDWSVTVDGEKKSGSNTVGISASSTKTLASGSKVIKHNADGSKTFSYSFSQEFGITFSGSSIGTKTGSGSGTLNTLPREASITTAYNFTDEGKPKVAYDNPAGSAATVQVGVYWDSSTELIPYTTVTGNGGVKEFTLTSAQQKAIWTKLASLKSKTIYYYIKTIIGDKTYISKVAKTVSITNATPTLSPVIKDTGSGSTALTGDGDNKIIKYFNYISINTGAAAKKNATIKSCKVTCGSKSIATVSGIMQNVESGDFVISITDSRGYTATQTVKKTLINYVNLNCNLTARAELAANNTTTANFTIKGNCFNGSFGAVANSLTVQYRYKVAGGSYGSWTTTTATKSGNTYTATGSITGLDYKSTYVIQARAIDSISTGGKASLEVLVKSTPVFDWGENDFNFNVPVFIGGTKYTGKNKVLWGGDRSSGLYMNEAQTAALTEGVSEQANGVILVFCYYAGTDNTNKNFESVFVPKELVRLTLGKTHVFQLGSITFNSIGAKVLIFQDDKTIIGSASNTNTGTGSTGITFHNNAYVLRYVIGV